MQQVKPEVDTKCVIAVKIRYVLELLHDSSTLLRKDIASFIYRFALIGIVIASHSYCSKLIEIDIASYIYHPKVTKSLSFLFATLTAGAGPGR